ncbi:hypothetical protein MTATph1_CDS0125 [Moorella phage MTATph1]
MTFSIIMTTGSTGRVISSNDWPIGVCPAG